MTNQEAIEELRARKEHYEMGDGCEFLVEALEKGIKALESQKTGKWIGDWFSPKCSICGKKPLYERYYGVDGEETSLLKSPYCPYCGAKMEGDK